MTNIKLSAKGQAFLSNGTSAMQLAKVIATKGSDLASKDGIVIKIGKKSISARTVSRRAI